MYRTPTMVAPWPWAKFKRNLASADLESHKPAVVVASGAFSLCHTSHVQMLHQAKERLERAGYSVLAGWLSPWGDGAALEKASWNEQAKLGATLRLKVAQLSVQDDPFVSVGTFETDEGIDGEGLHHYLCPGLLEEIRDLYADKLCGQEVRVFLVCGSDEAEEQMRKFHHPHRVIVPRGGQTFLLEKVSQFYVAEPIPGRGAYLAATQVRKALQDREMGFLTWAMHPAAVEFLFCGNTENFEIDADLVDFLGQGEKNDAGWWPTDILIHRLAAVPEDAKLVVLLASGAMSPATRGHVQMMHAAKERMERAGYAVIGGYLLPARKGHPELSQAFCQHVAELSVCDDEFLVAASLEAVGLPPKGEVEPKELVLAIRGAVLRRYPLSLEGRTLHAFYVVGEDCTARNVKDGLGGNDLGVVIVPASEDYTMEQPRLGLYMADAPPEGLGTSLGSAAVRALIEAGDTARAAEAMMPAAARFALSPTAAERERFREDFEKLGVAPAMEGERALVRDNIKGMLRSFTGPSGTIDLQDLERLIRMLDPSWTDKELGSLLTNAAKVQDGSCVVSDDFIDWIFSCR